MKWVYDDGGRAESGFRGQAGDCVTRAISIATGKPYREVYDEINMLAKTHERKGKRKRDISSARNGVYTQTLRRYLKSLGWVWVPTMQIGSGCTVHLRESELPMGKLIVKVSGHTCAVIDRVIYDTHNPDRDGQRCVYGYFYQPAKRGGQQQ
jgi:hypothetical protein